MSDEFELTAEVRTDVGKGASRRLRRNADLVPAIMYGAGKDPVSLTIPHKDFHKALENEAFFSHIITIKTGNQKDQAILKALQRHPSLDKIMHADFYRVRMDQAITVEVPLHFINEDQCPGVKLEGGSVAHLLNVVEVSCLPKDLPEYIEVDVAALNIGDMVHFSHLKLPDGVEIIALAQGEEHDNAVATVNAPRAEVEEEPVEGEAAEGEGEGAEGEGGEDKPADDAGEGDDNS